MVPFDVAFWLVFVHSDALSARSQRWNTITIAVMIAQTGSTLKLFVVVATAVEIAKSVFVEALISAPIRFWCSS